MKKIILITALTLLVKSVSFAQWVDIWDNSREIQGGCFATGNDTVFVPSGGGKIYRTINAGLNWDSTQTLFNSSWFNDICFPSKNIGYACGGTAFGTHTSCVAKTSNGGQTWDSLTSNSFGYEFKTMFFVNDSIGYLVGDLFVKTTDGGRSFSSIPIPFTSNQVAPVIESVYFFNSNTGLISTREYINSTKTRYRIARTIDGGISWTTAYLDSSVSSAATKSINAISFRNALTGCAVGNNGTLLTSANGGISWVKSSLMPESTHLYDVVLSQNSSLGYLVGWKSSPSGTDGLIYKTIDGGLSWQLDLSMPTERFNSIAMPTSEMVYVSSFNNVFKTKNSAVGIDQLLNDLEPLMYPNPTESDFFIELPNSIERNIELYNVFGQRMASVFSSDKSIKIDLSNFADGLYVISITAKGKKTTKKIMKQ